MDLGLTGKVAVVAAAGKGLGRACALALAREGARVTICARTEGDLSAAADGIRLETGADVLAVPADLSRAADIHAVVAATAERFGGVDILVNNSGGPRVGRFPDLTDEDWRQAFDLVTLNFVRFVREVVPYMRAKRWGRIVGIQSSSVKQPVAGIDLSNGVRPGIAGLMKAVMPDPGLADGAPADPDLEARLKSRAAQIPVGRLGEPAELGDLVAFLASERAAFITGATYQIDGGIIAANV
jgi:3-oxoacyl-[acyl-carrier protein] reductase